MNIPTPIPWSILYRQLPIQDPDITPDTFGNTVNLWQDMQYAWHYGTGTDVLRSITFRVFNIKLELVPTWEYVITAIIIGVLVGVFLTMLIGNSTDKIETVIQKRNVSQRERMNLWRNACL